MCTRRRPAPASRPCRRRSSWAGASLRSSSRRRLLGRHALEERIEDGPVGSPAADEGRRQGRADAIARAVDDLEPPVAALDEDVVFPEPDALAGWHDPAGRSRAEGLQERRPVAEIAPAD